MAEPMGARHGARRDARPSTPSPRLRLPGASSLDRPLSIRAEVGIVAMVLLVWQAARIPLEGSVQTAFEHAHEWISLQSTLGLTPVQNGVITLVHHPWLLPAARWSYANLHVLAIFTFLVAFRAAAPGRYPRVRNAFVLLHVPALIAIGAFPLASPSWLPHAPDWPGVHPSLTGSLDTDLRNFTATVVSEHFGYPVLIAAGTLWSARLRPIAWPIVLYPAWVFLFIVGTGHHYPLDAVVGSLCVAFGFTCSAVVHRRAARAEPSPRTVAPEPTAHWISLALGSGMLAGWVDAISSGRVRPDHFTLLDFVAPALAAVAFLVARRQRRPSRCGSAPDQA